MNRPSKQASGGDALQEWSCRDGGAGSLLRIKVQPRASRTALGQVRNGALTVHVTVPPADGEANAACRKLLAKLLGVAPSHVQIIRGATSRMKTIQVDGLNAQAVRLRVADALPS